MCSNDSFFRDLPSEEYQITSPRNPRYNALAWAIGEEEDERWWSPAAFDCVSYWPDGVAREETIETYTEIFRLHGYVPCEGNDESLEANLEKVAIYCKSGIPTHFARQLDNGQWTSKLGKNRDITHITLTCLEGKKYGFVHRILKRKRHKA
jgi:hypothetical protein